MPEQSRILYLLQHGDAFMRAAKIIKRLSELGRVVDVLPLRFSETKKLFLFPAYKSCSLVEYLSDSALKLELVFCDSVESFLVAYKLLQKNFPNTPVVCNLRAGPLAELVSHSIKLRREILEVLGKSSQLLLTGTVETELAKSWGLESAKFVELATPLSSKEYSALPVSDGISLAGDFSHAGTMRRFLALSAKLPNVLSAISPEIKLYVEGSALAQTGLPEHPPSLQPKARLFVSDKNEYDNFLLLLSLVSGVPVIAAEPAVFGLGLTHSREYLAANHPRTFLEQFVRLFKDESLANGLTAMGKAFIEHKHTPAEFRERVAQMVPLCVESSASLQAAV